MINWIVRHILYTVESGVVQFWNKNILPRLIYIYIYTLKRQMTNDILTNKPKQTNSVQSVLKKVGQGKIVQ